MMEDCLTLRCRLCSVQMLNKIGGGSRVRMDSDREQSKSPFGSDAIRVLLLLCMMGEGRSSRSPDARCAT